VIIRVLIDRNKSNKWRYFFDVTKFTENGRLHCNELFSKCRSVIAKSKSVAEVYRLVMQIALEILYYRLQAVIMRKIPLNRHSRYGEVKNWR